MGSGPVTKIMLAEGVVDLWRNERTCSSGGDSAFGGNGDGEVM